MILLRIRGETIKFSTIKKQQEQEREKNLIKDISTLEQNQDLSQITDLLENKKDELQNIRNV